MKLIEPVAATEYWHIPSYSDSETENSLFMSGLPTECHATSRNRKTIIYSMSYAMKVLLISVTIFSLITSIIQKKVDHLKSMIYP